VRCASRTQTALTEGQRPGLLHIRLAMRRSADVRLPTLALSPDPAPQVRHLFPRGTAVSSAASSRNGCLVAARRSRESHVCAWQPPRRLLPGILRMRAPAAGRRRASPLYGISARRQADQTQDIHLRPTRQHELHVLVQQPAVSRQPCAQQQLCITPHARPPAASPHSISHPPTAPTLLGPGAQVPGRQAPQQLLRPGVHLHGAAAGEPLRDQGPGSSRLLLRACPAVLWGGAQLCEHRARGPKGRTCSLLAAAVRALLLTTCAWRRVQPWSCCGLFVQGCMGGLGPGLACLPCSWALRPALSPGALQRSR
jgi:hypothetical protein